MVSSPTRKVDGSATRDTSKAKPRALRAAAGFSQAFVGKRLTARVPRAEISKVKTIADPSGGQFRVHLYAVNLAVHRRVHWDAQEGAQQAGFGMTG